MTKKITLIIAFLILYKGSSTQVLSVNAVIQEQNQWCWAAVSACVLAYYGTNKSQCEIAEYTRSVATWHNFGSVDCCVNSNQGCNYWNYNWGYAGSIRDILIYFGGIDNVGVGSALSQQLIAAELSANRLFIIRWGWTGGGGHFLVGHGLSGGNLHYMDPWYGEGLKVANYDWVVSSTNHTWTSTNRLAITTSVNEPQVDSKWNVFPNPVFNELTLTNTENPKSASYEISAICGRVFDSGTFAGKTIINTSNLSAGFYLVSINDGTSTFVKKILKP